MACLAPLIIGSRLPNLLQKTIPFFLVDQRNHGRSPWSSDWNYQLMANDLLEFINQHNIINPVLIGHSMGGKTVMNLLLKMKISFQK